MKYGLFVLCACNSDSKSFILYLNGCLLYAGKAHCVDWFAEANSEAEIKRIF